MAEAEAPCSPTQHPQSSEDRKLLTITVPRKRTKDFAQTPCSLVDVFIFKSQFRKYLASRCLPSLGFPGGSAVKNPPAVQKIQEMWVRSLDQEHPLRACSRQGKVLQSTSRGVFS